MIKGHLVVAPIQLLDLANIDDFLFLPPTFRNAKLVVASDGAIPAGINKSHFFQHPRRNSRYSRPMKVEI